MQKTIKINPELFTIGKTDKIKNSTKNKSIKNRPSINEYKNGKIKQKLLDKIKNFQKNKEIGDDLDKPSMEINKFEDSIAFLTNLSDNYHSQKLNKTLKNKFSDENIEVSTQLPSELDNNIQIQNDNHKNYGCLKNGSLPTFREWRRMTQKNKDNNETQMRIKINTDDNQYYDNNLQFLEREKRLQEIKNKFREKNIKSNDIKSNDIKSNDIRSNDIRSNDARSNDARSNDIRSNDARSNDIRSNDARSNDIRSNDLINLNNNELIQINNKSMISNMIEKNNQVTPTNITENNIPDTNNVINENTDISYTPISSINIDNEEINVYNIPKILRKTKTLKFKLGRNNKQRKIGVYIKNRETLKNIKTDFNKLKNVDINEIKKYLRKHNLINTGTTSPNDVLRELYEKAILSGDVINNNTNNLLNNFINDD